MYTEDSVSKETFIVFNYDYPFIIKEFLKNNLFVQENILKHT